MSIQQDNIKNLVERRAKARQVSFFFYNWKENHYNKCV